MARPRRRFPFDRPGRATLWGLVAIPASAIVTTMHAGWQGLVTVAVVTALAGCWKPA